MFNIKKNVQSKIRCGFILLLVVALMFSFSACGNSDENSSKSSSLADVTSITESQETLSSDVVTSEDTLSSDAASKTSSEKTSSNKPSGNNSKPSSINTSGGGSNMSQPTSSNQATPKSDKVVICFGDSITEGMGMKIGEHYPSVLGEYLSSQYRVINAGVGGENSYTISARANALEFTVTSDMVFEAGVKEVVSNWEIFSGINGELMRLRYGYMGNGLSIGKLIIDGKSYTLRYKAGKDEPSAQYILGRSNADEKVVISKGTKVKFDYSSIYKEDKLHCVVILIGANDRGEVSIDELIERYKAIAKTADNFIALIPHYDTDYTAQFEAAFGNKCVNLREYCLNEDIYKKYGIKKTQRDQQLAKEGEMPASLTYNFVPRDCHLNATGYKILADLVYEKGVELGYWK